ncbi:WD40 repeat protein [Malassezia psittaci]|uniref:WD40 repeat protein n=1 Tax=Malassezia psittaci TaxID=1821823 RepID=A0AAF0FFJ0_9BASI|nr:WD40 repeat protein [Malassezia psittaci]
MEDKTIVEKYGENLCAAWRSDTCAIVVQTNRDMLLFYEVEVRDTLYTYGTDPQSLPAPQHFQHTFQQMPGEQFHMPLDAPTGAGTEIKLVFRHAIAVEPRIASLAAYDAYLLISTISPPAVQLMPWPDLDTNAQPTVLLKDLPWLQSELLIQHLTYSRAMAIFVWLSSNRAYVAQYSGQWSGICFCEEHDQSNALLVAAVNARFSLVTVGDSLGGIRLFEYQSVEDPVTLVATFQLPAPITPGKVLTITWTTDGYALLAGYEQGWALWSTYGALLAHSFRDDWESCTRVFRDEFMFGVRSAFFGPSNTELFLVSERASKETVAYVLPLVKSASSLHMLPEEASNAVLVSDDRVMIYRGYELQDQSLLAQDNDAWRHVMIPGAYLASHWPIRYASLSSDASFLAIAGRRGLVHFSCESGRWKAFSNPVQEHSFSVRGGLLWFQHVLIAACDADGEYQIRLYSRDTDLNNAHLLDLIKLPSPVQYCFLFDTSLLVYTTDNSLYHYLITPTEQYIRLRLCGSISFEGIIGEPARVRAMSWILPPGQQALGDPAQDLSIASLLFLIDGKVVLLQPAQIGDQAQEDVSYDLQILHTRIEVYWTNLQDRGPLHDSLWCFDGQSIAVWPSVTSIVGGITQTPGAMLPQDTYPASLLLAKGAIVGMECYPVVRRTIDTALWQAESKVTPFLHTLLQVYLDRKQLDTAVEMANRWRSLIYFGHSLELLLHDVLEQEADARPPIAKEDQRLSLILQFLDHFEIALQIVAHVARKTEASRWPMLFAAAGEPHELLMSCVEEQDADTARQYLLVVYEMETREISIAMTAQVLAMLARNTDWDALREVLSFVRSLDEDGERFHASMQALQPMLPADSPLRLGTTEEPSRLQAPKPALVSTPRRPGSQPKRADYDTSSSPIPRTRLLQNASRHASLNLTPTAVPVWQSNGRIVMAPNQVHRP